LESGEDSSGTVIRVVDPAPRLTLRRPTIARAPFVLIGLGALAAAVALVLAGLWDPANRTTSWWGTVAVAVTVGLGGFALASGCRIEVRGDTLRDVVGWVTIRRVNRPSIVTARVLRGPWRLFVLELADGSAVTLLGSSPTEWPARLLPGSTERDEADLRLLLGDDDAVAQHPRQR
jgi:hypothetical protein